MKYLLPYILPLVACFTSSIAAENADSLFLFRKGDSLFRLGQYFEAAAYFHKAEYFFNSPLAKADCLVRCAEAHKQRGSYRDGIRVLDFARIESLPDTAIFALKFQSALLAFLEADFGLAESYLTQVSYFVSDSTLIYRTFLLRALVLNEQARWTEAESFLRKLNRFQNSRNEIVFTDSESTLDSLYRKKNLPVLKNKKKAAMLSSFVPGLGQCYAGYAGEGIVSFGSVLGCTAGIVLGVMSEYYFSSIFLGQMLLGKFYLGGIKRTEFLVDKRNYGKCKDFNQRLRNSLIKKFK